jgi:serine O-acetyltransferase
VFRTFRTDLVRFGGRDALFDPGIYALTIYRFGRWAKQRTGITQKPLLRFYRGLSACVQLGFGVAIPAETNIGSDLTLIHGNGVRIHPEAVIGNGCTIMHEVTIGTGMQRKGAPSIGDGVFIGAGAKVLGPVRVGAGAMIAANSLVITDVPEGATVMGVPARVIPVARTTAAKSAETPAGS